MGSGRMADALNLIPLRPVDLEMRVAFGTRMHFGDFEAIGAIEPLPKDFGAANHGDLGDRTPQGIAKCDRACIRGRCRDDGAGG